MFTGIVQALGSVLANVDGVLTIRHGIPGAQHGESIAVNGVCLTVTGSSQEDSLHFDLSPETLARTSLGSLKTEQVVNLERALRVGDSLGGHFVQGHVDAVGSVDVIREEGNGRVFTFRAPNEYGRYLIDKGSICVDGISLTVVNPREGVFDTWIVPHTFESTNLHALTTGGRVNLEFDVLAKYMEKLLGRA